MLSGSGGSWRMKPTHLPTIIRFFAAPLNITEREGERDKGHEDVDEPQNVACLGCIQP